LRAGAFFAAFRAADFFAGAFLAAFFATATLPPVSSDDARMHCPSVELSQSIPQNLWIFMPLLISVSHIVEVDITC